MNQRILDAAVELLAVARLRGDDDLPHPADDPKLWTARMVDAWGELATAVEELGPAKSALKSMLVFPSGRRCFMADYTLGPFSTDQAVSDHDGCDIVLDVSIPEAGCPILVASLFPDDPKDGHVVFTAKDCRKIARLFAASPHLLAALELAGDALCKVTWELRSKTPKSVNDAIDVVRAAIAKVKPHIFSPVGNSTPADRDKCRLCGHDIRNSIHLVMGEAVANG